MLVPWPPGPFVEGQFAALFEVFLEYGFIHEGCFPVVDVGVDFVVYSETAGVHVGAAYAGEVVVTDEGLGMDEFSLP